MDTPLLAIDLSRLAYVFHQVRPSSLIPHLDALNAAAAEAQINTPDRWSMWLAMIGVECQQLQRWEENLNYSAEGLLKTWPKHFNAALASWFEHNPERIGNHVYSGRNGNGDEASGDGYRYRGRGAIQITGFSNYLAAGKYLDLDLRAQPDLAAGDARFRVAAWFWMARGLNHFADQRDVEDCTKAINGGLTGLADRKALFSRAQEILSSGGGL